MATYSGGIQVDEAATLLRSHVISLADGLCRECELPGPCESYEQAMKVFLTAVRLPRRMPGATRPELLRARRIGRPGPLKSR